MPIDDPLDQAFQQNREEDDWRIPNLVISTVGAAVSWVGVVSTIRSFFNQQSQRERLRLLFDAFRDEIEESRARHAESESRLETLESTLAATFSEPDALNALLAAATMSVQLPDPNRIRRFARLLGSQAATPSTSWREAEAFIRDLVNLTESDLEALRVLFKIQSPFLVEGRMPLDPNRYTERISDLLAEADKSFEREEFYSRCGRLTGFGLALEVPPNTLRMARDHCFRITTRGIKLMKLLTK